MSEAAKGNGHDQAAELPVVKSAQIKLDDAARNRHFGVLTAQQFKHRLDGAIWASKTPELRLYDEITVVDEAESEMSRLLVTDMNIGHCHVVELSHIKLPPKLVLEGARIPPGYEVTRDLKGYRIKRSKDGAWMTVYHEKLEFAVRDLLDHATLQQR